MPYSVYKATILKGKGTPLFLKISKWKQSVECGGRKKPVLVWTPSLLIQGHLLDRGASDLQPSRGEVIRNETMGRMNPPSICLHICLPIINPSTHPSNRLPIYPSIHPPAHPLTARFSTHSLIHSLVHLFVRPPITHGIYTLNNPSFFSPIHSSTHPSSHPPTSPCTSSHIHPLIHLSMQPASHAPRIYYLSQEWCAHCGSCDDEASPCPWGADRTRREQGGIAG